MLAGLAGLALAVALPPASAASAQPSGKVHRIGFLAARARPTAWKIDYYNGFVKGMRKLGYVEGKNLVIEWRFADGKPERLPELAAELVNLGVEVIVTGGTPAIRAAQKATRTIPIVMAASADPVGSGFVESMARPGGNVTGSANLTDDLSPKHFQLLKSVVPELSRVAILMNPDNEFYTPVLKRYQNASRDAKVALIRLEARTPGQIEGAFRTIGTQKIGALLVPVDVFFVQQRHQIAGLAARQGLPSMFAVAQHAEAGGLMSYGQNLSEIYRSTARYVDKILKGAKPGDLPVEQPAGFELIVNARAARGMGVEIPQPVLAMADRGIR